MNRQSDRQKKIERVQTLGINKEVMSSINSLENQRIENATQTKEQKTSNLVPCLGSGSPTLQAQSKPESTNNSSNN
jgi:hypothetical protein